MQHAESVNHAQCHALPARCLDASHDRQLHLTSRKRHWQGRIYKLETLLSAVCYKAKPLQLPTANAQHFDTGLCNMG